MTQKPNKTMAKNSMTDLRDHLFETIEMLKANSDPDASPKEKIDLATAKQIADVAQVIVNSVKLDVEFCAILSKAENRESVIAASKGNKMLPQSNEKMEG